MENNNVVSSAKNNIFCDVIDVYYIVYVYVKKKTNPGYSLAEHLIKLVLYRRSDHQVVQVAFDYLNMMLRALKRFHENHKFPAFFNSKS